MISYDQQLRGRAECPGPPGLMPVTFRPSRAGKDDEKRGHEGGQLLLRMLAINKWTSIPLVSSKFHFSPSLSDSPLYDPQLLYPLCPSLSRWWQEQNVGL